MEKNNISVLIVDDNPADARLIVEMLKESQSLSFKSSQAGRIDKTLKMLEDKEFDAVLLDLNLPDSNGLAGLERIVVKVPQTPVILLTGVDSEKLGIQALQKNASDYLVKGQITSAVLARAIRYAIERKRSEAALRESEEKYRKLVRYAPAAIYEMDLQGTKFLDVNQVMCDILGYSREELLALNPTELMAPESRSIFRERIKNKLAGEKIDEEVEYRIRRKDGEWIYTAINVGAVTYSKEEPSRVVVVGHDVTERKQAQKDLQESRAAALSLMEDAVEARQRSESDRDALRESEARLKFAQAAAGAGTWDWDMVTGKLEWSEELFLIFGLDPREKQASFDTWRNIIHPGDRKTADNRIAAAIRDRVALSNEYRVILPSGQERWINALGNTVYDAGGEPLRMSGICVDITGRKEHEASLLWQQQHNIILSEAASLLLAADDPQRVIDAVAHRTMEFLDCEVFFNFMADEKEHVLLLNAYAGISAKEAKCIERLDYGAAVSGYGVRAYYCHPLIAGTETIGTLSFGTKQRDAFTEQEIAMMNAVADIVSTAMYRKRSKDALNLAHEKLKTILGSITEAYIVFDRQGRFVELNKTAEELLGRKAEELRGKSFWKVFPKAREIEFYRQFRKALARNKDAHFEAFSSIVSKWFETHAYPFPDGLTVYLHDISQRKAAEDVLRETRDYLDSLINYANAPIIVWDTDFRIARFNHAFEFISEYESYEVLGKELSMLFPEDSKNESLSKIERTLKGEHWESVEVPIRCKSGSVKMLLWNSANIYQENKKLLAIIAQGQDITERKKAEEALLKAREELEERVAQRTSDLIKAQKELMAAKRLSDIGALSATVAHELRNPLGVIRAAAFNMRRKNQDPNLGKHLDRIDKKILESGQIINNLLFYSRIKTPQFENVRLAHIVKEAIVDAKIKYKGTRVIIKNSFIGIKNTAIDGDPAQLHELFSNILNNAYEAFKEKKGIIQIIGVFDDRNALAKVSVIDNGCGIPEDILHKIQDPFFTTKSQGTGLGLAVCYQVARLHGGSIEVTSSKGQGSIFTVILPAKPSSERAA